MRGASVSIVCLGWLFVFGCGGKTPPAEPKAPPPLPAQTGYCERLQPLLDKTVRAARIGTEMSCLDVPGVTDLGRFGPPNAGEEGSLLNCFERAGDYEALLHAPEAAFQLSIDEAFAADTRTGAGANLTALVPWLPRIDVSADRATRLSASVTIKEARFVTLVGVASKLQEQERQRCLEALCKPDYTYVHKALVGIPSVVVTAKDESGKEVALGLPPASANFSQRDVQRGAREITSNKPITLAIARSSFRTGQTERLCQFCGKRGQGCCAEGPACDGGLGCIAGQCVELGHPGQPCDGDSCTAGATCVRGSCRVECGSKGAPCCGERECSGRLRCVPDPDNGIEHAITSDQVQVTGGIFGTDEDRTFGNSSCGSLRKRARFAVTKLGSGRGECEKIWWFDPKNEHDCRVAVHFNVSTLGEIQCRVEVFATLPPKPDVCLP